MVPVGQLTKHSVGAGHCWCGMLQQPLGVPRVLDWSRGSDGAEGKPSIFPLKTGPHIKVDLNVRQLNGSAEGLRGHCVQEGKN